MAVDDPKRAALLAEGMTEGEIDYMSSGGTKTEGLTPPADDGAAAAAPPEPAKTSPAEPAKPAAQPGAQPGAAPPEPHEDDDPEPAKDSPFYPQWKREKGRRQELQRELKARDEAIASERAATAVERERFARIDERLRVFQQAIEPEPAKPAAPPDPEADPFGAIKWLMKENDELRNATTQVSTNVQERDAATELKDIYVRDAREFVGTQPDFRHAYEWLIETRGRQLQAWGITDPAERERRILEDERDLVARAITRGERPAKAIYDFAKLSGFQAPAQTQGAVAGRHGNGAAAPSNGAAAPDTPSVTQQVEAIQRGQAASRSLSSAGGAPAATGMDLAKLADMDDNEYLAWKSALTAPQRKELASLLGAPGR